MGLIDRIREGTYVAPADDSRPRLATGQGTSIAETARRIRSDDDFMLPIREFLDQVCRIDDAGLELLLVESPPATGHAEADALLAGIAEHLAVTRDLACPPWTQESGRFLDRFWFVSREPAFRAIALAQTPIALKRRGVFWPARSMVRV